MNFIKSGVMKRSIIIIFIVFMLNHLTWAQQAYFADGNLKSAVESWMGLNNPTIGDMLDLTYLSVINRNIYNLTGLEYAANLRSFTFPTIRSATFPRCQD